MSDLAELSPLLVFRIAAVPDVVGLRGLHGLPAALADNEVVEFAYQKGRALADASNAPDVLGLHLQRVVSIACCVQDDAQFRVVSLADDDEATLIQRFADLVKGERAQPVGWDTARFDWPVLRNRSLVCGAVPGAVLEAHVGQFDLASLFAAPDGGRPGLHELARLCGFPGQRGLADNQIWNAWRAGKRDAVHAHCATDAVIGHLVCLRSQMTLGLLDESQYAAKVRMVRAALEALNEPPWREFLADWA
ncbi:hypothetical protein VVD49_21595 [Uliginosibacterium sp. H3]|uniref:Predicted 3'-5' exonuclease PolB-like domain-containing protein n=1 Tax=Uliginosibacterium silvisoli TaxID=3114758 RepID=A0ABU6K9X7_9RHOO|nr:hypothetical protein [Uliginosibacterium sp. H3]